MDQAVLNGKIQKKHSEASPDRQYREQEVASDRRAWPTPAQAPSTTSFPRIMFMPQANVNSPVFSGVNSMLVVL